MSTLETIRMPDGYEPMSAEAVDGLKYHDSVCVLECQTGDVYSGLVEGVRPGKASVRFGNRHVEGFYVDEPDFEDRGPAMTVEGEYMLITTKCERRSNVANDDLVVQMQTSINERLAARIIRLESAASEQNNKMQALLADMHTMREELNALRSLVPLKVA